MCTVIDGNGMCALGYVQPQKRHMISVAVLSGHKIDTEESDNLNIKYNSKFVQYKSSFVVCYKTITQLKQYSRNLDTVLWPVVAGRCWPLFIHCNRGQCRTGGAQ